MRRFRRNLSFLHILPLGDVTAIVTLGGAFSVDRFNFRLSSWFRQFLVVIASRKRFRSVPLMRRDVEGRTGLVAGGFLVQDRR
jgi:hypothetical protein